VSERFAIVPLLREAVVETVLVPRRWLPALALLLPVLALQLAFPGYLRSRLSPSLSTVVLGGLAIAWLTQVAGVAAVGWVHRQRQGEAVAPLQLAVVALLAGTGAFAGLLAGAIPGLWLQARWAFAPLTRGQASSRAALGESASRARPHMWTLAALGVTTLVLSVLGQSMAAGAADALGTIVPAAVVDGRTRFELHYLPHAATSILAWWLAALAMTVQAVGVSRVAVRAGAPVAQPVLLRPHWRPTMRAAAWASGALVLALGIAAATFKLQQHLH